MLGVGKLRAEYGGRKSRGVKPHRFKKSGGKIIRVWIQLLEKEGYLQKQKVGRILSAKGQQFLNQKAEEWFGKNKTVKPTEELQ